MRKVGILRVISVSEINGGLPAFYHVDQVGMALEKDIDHTFTVSRDIEVFLGYLLCKAIAYNMF